MFRQYFTGLVLITMGPKLFWNSINKFFVLKRHSYWSYLSIKLNYFGKSFYPACSPIFLFMYLFLFVCFHPALSVDLLILDRWDTKIGKISLTLFQLRFIMWYTSTVIQIILLLRTRLRKHKGIIKEGSFRNYFNTLCI